MTDDEIKMILILKHGSLGNALESLEYDEMTSDEERVLRQWSWEIFQQTIVKVMGDDYEPNDND